MLKNILNQKGTKALSKNEQKQINGGDPSLCDKPLIYCSEERVFDPCAPITERNYGC